MSAISLALLTGIAFFAVKFIGGTVLSLIVPPGLMLEVIAHIIGLPATPYFVLVVLRSVGLL
jgi:hypothetical protein